MDGYVEGIITGISEQAAQEIVSGGNPYAARIVRAPLETLLSTRSIGAFSTAARGVRNPYGITRDPAGRIWFTDNGATNVPDEISAGDEVNVLNPGAVTGDEGSSLYYGFPLALNGSPADWYTGPVAGLVNSAAPTGIAWAYDTIFFGVYGRNPGLYRLGSAADGTVVAERILVAWPVLAVVTAPDGALWIGLGDGGLYRLTPGC
jgi:glucose/arabinose dehydrogenase